MQPKLAILLSLIFLSTNAFGQYDPVEVAAARKKIDSIHVLINSNEPDSVRAMQLTDIGSLMAIKRFYDFDPIYFDSIDVYSIRALKLSQQIQYGKGMMYALQVLGASEELVEKYASELTHYQQGLQIAESTKSYRYVDTFCVLLLNRYFYNGDFTNAMKIASKGISLAAQMHDDRLTAKYLNVMGFIHYRQNNIAEAEKYYNQYLGLAQKLNDSMMIADANNSMGEAAMALRKYDKALDYYNKALRVYQDKRIYELFHQRDKAPYTLFKIGFLYGEKGDFKKSLEYLNRCIELTKVYRGNLYDYAKYFIYAGYIYNQLHDYTHAIDVLYKGLAIAKQIRHKEDTRDAYGYLSQLYAARKEYDSAYHYSFLYHNLKDSISNESSRREISNINDAYQLDTKNQQIESLNQQKKLQDAEIRANVLQRNIVIGLAFLLSIVGFLLYKRYQLKKKTQLQEEINKRQNELFNISTTIQDQERKRIAQDLHDGLGSLLSAAKLKLSGLQQSDKHPQKMKDILHLLDDAVTELRHISQNIMPAALSKLGLVAALQSIFDHITADSALRIHFTAYDFDNRLENETEISIYRIVLELVNNVVKHAGANNVTVQLIRYPDHVNITVEDDGKGFTHGVSNGTGLNNIRSRIAYLKGAIEIDSREGKGTNTIVDIPCAL